MKKTLFKALLSLMPFAAFCQTDQAAPATEPTSMAAPSQQPPEGTLSRWLNINTLSFSMRYRNTADANGFHLFHFGQERSLIDGAFKFDREGKYSINFHASSGKYFNWAYASEIGGSFATAINSIPRLTPSELAFAGATIGRDFATYELVQKHLSDRGWEMYMRQLYFSAAPVKQLAMDYGSMPIEHGVNSEMTTYDDDGYLVGGRAQVKDPDHLYLDQALVTFGYVGDVYFPSVFDRGADFKRTNYGQFMGEKKFGSYLDTSVDYTAHLGTHTMREAAMLKIPSAKIVDFVRAEFYQRMNAIELQGFNFGGGSGFGLTASKKLNKQLKIEGGFASIDKNYPVYTGSSFFVAVGHSLNGDAYAIGNRFFERAAYKPAPYLTLVGYYTHILDTNFMTLNKQTIQGGFEFDMKELLNQKFHLF